MNFKPLSVYIGLRYLRAKRNNHFISFISLISMIGIGLGVATLITVLSVMNGFNHEIRTRILSLTPHVVVMGWNNNPLHHADTLQTTVQNIEGVAGTAPFVDGQVMLTEKGHVQGAMLKGIDPKQIEKVYPLSESVTEGTLEALQSSRYGVIVGEALAQNLGLEMGSHVTLIAPEAQYGALGVTPRMRRFEVVGFFKVGYVYDQHYMFTHIQDAARLFHLEEGDVSGIQVRLDDYLSAPRIAKTIRTELNEHFYVGDWTTQNASYFHAVKMEKTMMFLILTLIVAVAAFNLVSTLVMCVTDKQSDIAILRTMGALPSTIVRIFMVQGLASGILGTFLGVGLGMLLSLHITEWVEWIQRAFSVELLSSDFYYISFLPAQLEWSDIFLVGGISMLLAFLATLYPAWRAAKIQPAEALRYE